MRGGPPSCRPSISHRNDPNSVGDRAENNRNRGRGCLEVSCTGVHADDRGSEEQATVIDRRDRNQRATGGEEAARGPAREWRRSAGWPGWSTAGWVEGCRQQVRNPPEVTWLLPAATEPDVMVEHCTAVAVALVPAQRAIRVGAGRSAVVGTQDGRDRARLRPHRNEATACTGKRRQCSDRNGEGTMTADGGGNISSADVGKGKSR